MHLSIEEETRPHQGVKAYIAELLQLIVRVPASRDPISMPQPAMGS